MKCPYCGTTNMAGADECESCREDLTSLNSNFPKTKVGRALVNDPIEKLKPHMPIAIDEGETLASAVKRMDEGNIGCLLVMKGNGLAGILTERDILLKASGKGTDLARVCVRDIMTPDPETLSPEDSIAYAVNKMSLGGFRHIPIMKEGRPAGIISVKDVLCYISGLLSK